MTIASVGDLRIGYDDVGIGDVLVLLHGFPLNRSMWKGQLSGLPYRMVAPDLRGHGESTVTSGTVTMSQMAQDLNCLLDHLSIHEAVHLGGLSMGGYVAWEFWLQFSSRVKSLLLFDTRAVGDTEEVARARRMMASQVISAGASMAAKTMLPKLVSEKTKVENPSVAESLESMILGTDPEAIAATQRGMAERRDMTDHLKDVDVSTLVVCGEYDVISTPKEMQGFAQEMPKSEFVEISDGGHLAPLEQPAAVNMAIQRFLG